MDLVFTSVSISKKTQSFLKSIHFFRDLFDFFEILKIFVTFFYSNGPKNPVYHNDKPVYLVFFQKEIIVINMMKIYCCINFSVNRLVDQWYENTR